MFHLKNARENLAAGDISRKADSLRKAMDILFYLDATLDSNEPEAASPLHDSYQLILHQLSLGNSGNSVEALEIADKWLSGLLEAWQGLGRSSGENKKKGEPSQ